MNTLVIVEGFNDCWAVHRAVRAPVFVLGGGYALAEAMKPELQYLSRVAASGLLPRQLVVFTDPDWQGRMFRTYLDDVLPLRQPVSVATAVKGPTGLQQPGGLLQPTPAAQSAISSKGLGRETREEVVVRHAFLRMELGTSEEGDRYHEAGSVGVEHAAPHTIRAALKRARRRFGTERHEFSLEELQGDGLVGAWNDKEKVAGSQLRRCRFCRALGIDEVGTGKGLLNMLNRFFTREEYIAALQVAS